MKTGIVDPLAIEIIRGAMNSTIREMELLMVRCAMSPFIKKKNDHFVGIYARTGRMVPSHISASGFGLVAPILRAYPFDGMRPGNAYWFNDPYLFDGAVEHHQDMVFAVPLFDHRTVVSFTVKFGHVSQ